MINLRAIWGVLASAAVFSLLAGCGGGSSITTSVPTQGNGNLGGIQTGNGQPGGGSSSFKPAIVAAGDISPEAPLGTNPAYNMTLVTGENSGFEADHSASVVVGPVTGELKFEVIDLTMVKDGAAADWNLNSNTFKEGEQVDLYIKYTADATLKLTRFWNAKDINVQQTDTSVSHASSGTYTVKLDSYIPYGKVGSNYIFNYNLTRTDDGSNLKKGSANFLYSITAQSALTQPRYPTVGDAQIAWEDLLVDSDYDYNDFVCSINMTEWHIESTGDLAQISFRVKALARGAGYGGAWQFNMSNAFPGATVQATVKQYYANGTAHGSTRTWKSSNGTDIPVFTDAKQALPEPNGYYATNTEPGTKFIDGDYADVVIIFDKPIKSGTYTPMPYNPQLKVTASANNVYQIGIWTKKGDKKDSQGNTLVDENGRPLAFVVPKTYAWPLEGIPAWEGYSTYNTWINWIKSTTLPEPAAKWWDLPPTNSSKVYSRGKFT